MFLIYLSLETVKDREGNIQIKEHIIALNNKKQKDDTCIYILTLFLMDAVILSANGDFLSGIELRLDIKSLLAILINDPDF